MAKAHKSEMETVEKVIQWMEDGKEIRNGMDVWTTSDVDHLNTYQLLTAKPVVYLVNLTQKDFTRTPKRIAGTPWGSQGLTGNQRDSQGPTGTHRHRDH